MAGREVRVVITGDDQASGTLTSVATKIRAFRGASEEAGRGLGRIGNILSDISREALGATGPLGNLADKVLEFGVGGGVFVALAAAAATILGFFSNFTKGAREAQEAYDGWLKSLQKTSALSIVGRQMEELQHKLDNMDDSFLGRLTRTTREFFAEGDKKSLLGKLFGVSSAEEIETQLDTALKQYQDLLKSFEAQREEITNKILKENLDKRQQEMIERGTMAAEIAIRGAGGPQVIGSEGTNQVRSSGLGGVDPGELPNTLEETTAGALSLAEAFRLVGEVTPAIAEGLDAINNSALASIPGFGIVAKAAQKAVQIVAKVEGAIAIAKGAVKVAESIWPFNPAGLASGTKTIAEGAKLAALGGGSGGGGGSYGGGGGGQSFTGSVQQTQQLQRDTIEVMLPPIIPTTDPGVQDWLAEVIRNAGGRNVRFTVGVS